MNATAIAPASVAEFPRSMLSLLRCTRDTGELTLAGEPRGSLHGVVEGLMRCSQCAAEYRIESGIARFLTPNLTAEDRHEMALKDQEYHAMPEHFVAPKSSWRSEFNDMIEVPPHLNAVSPLHEKRVLELGCGDGRFTILMAQLGAQVLAFDFSIEGLRRVAANAVLGKAPTNFKLRPAIGTADLRGRIGLVHAHAGSFAVAPCSFDRALSATPLDGRDERMRMYRIISDALRDDGRFVGGVEHDYLFRRLLGLPVARRYSPGGIFLEHLDAATMRREAAPFFSRLRIRPIRAHVPFVSRLPTRLAASLSIAACTLPGVRQLGEILLMSADRPIRPTANEAKRRGNKAAKTFYRWYKRLLGQEPMWDLVDRV